jgi:hypothetical protein
MAKPGHPFALSAARRRKLFGAFHWRKTPGKTRAIEILDNWERENITTVAVPQLVGVDTYGGRFSGAVQFNHQCVAQLRGAWEEVERAGLLDLVLFWDGSFVPRCIGASPPYVLSPHSWGIAFDINARWNAYNQAPAPAGRPGTVAPLVPIFEAWGFAWGGWFDQHPDGMHFEVCAAGLTEPCRPQLIIGDTPLATAQLELREGHAWSPVGPLAQAIGDASNCHSKAVVPVAEYLRAHGYAVVWQPDQGSCGAVVATSRAAEG